MTEMSKECRRLLKRTRVAIVTTRRITRHAWGVDSDGRVIRDRHFALYTDKRPRCMCPVSTLWWHAGRLRVDFENKQRIGEEALQALRVCLPAATCRDDGDAVANYVDRRGCRKRDVVRLFDNALR